MSEKTFGLPTIAPKYHYSLKFTMMKKEEISKVMEKFGFFKGGVTTFDGEFRHGFYEYGKRNKKDEKIIVEVVYCTGTNCKNSLPVIWYENGYTDRLILEYWSIQTYVYDKDGCWGRYNPTEKLSDVGKRLVIDFDWHFEATTENLEKLVTEVLRRFNS